MTTTDTDLRNLIGPVAYREFENAPDWSKDKLRAWCERLPTLSDDDLFTETVSAIHDSALAGRFRGNWDHDHCRASAAYHESTRRHVAAGHAKDCAGDCIYARAYRQVGRECGIGTRPPADCTCGKGDN